LCRELSANVVEGLCDDHQYDHIHADEEDSGGFDSEDDDFSVSIHTKADARESGHHSPLDSPSCSPSLALGHEQEEEQEEEGTAVSFSETNSPKEMMDDEYS
jgi:hypothetical protein